MKYAHEVLDLMEAYPARSFRAGELVRHATRGRLLAAAEREAARKVVKRVRDALIATGAVSITHPAEVSGASAEYSVSRFRDVSPTKAGQEAGQYVRALAS
ncbi:hypothetical protein [Achromobacter sp. Marseille-Q4954]|uniref:hypothetical protein n=1 Tax=Achromobacter sp. Marseille-Q4954 TaxID=2942203 RepID=UPI00207316EF|nr:hypothetical protein [Achromobacter sp. Marseille-Q4954]